MRNATDLMDRRCPGNTGPSSATDGRRALISMTARRAVRHLAVPVRIPDKRFQTLTALISGDSICFPVASNARRGKSLA